MNCQDVQNRIVDYTEGRLAPEAWEAVRRHLPFCPTCRTALARVDSLAELFVSLTDAPPPPDLTERVMAAAGVLARTGAPRGRQAKPAVEWNPWHWWRAATRSLRWASVALALAGVALGTLAGRQAMEAPASDRAVPADPLAGHAVDYLADAPEGSLAGSYAALLKGDGEAR